MSSSSWLNKSTFTASCNNLVLLTKLPIRVKELVIQTPSILDLRWGIGFLQHPETKDKINEIGFGLYQVHVFVLCAGMATAKGKQHNKTNSTSQVWWSLSLVVCRHLRPWPRPSCRRGDDMGGDLGSPFPLFFKGFSIVSWKEESSKPQASRDGR